MWYQIRFFLSRFFYQEVAPSKLHGRMNICIQVMEGVNTDKLKMQENKLEDVAIVTNRNKNCWETEWMWEAAEWADWMWYKQTKRVQKNSAQIHAMREHFLVLDFNEKSFSSSSLTFTSLVLRCEFFILFVNLSSVTQQPPHSTTHLTEKACPLTPTGAWILPVWGWFILLWGFLRPVGSQT